MLNSQVTIPKHIGKTLLDLAFYGYSWWNYRIYSKSTRFVAISIGLMKEIIKWMDSLFYPRLCAPSFDVEITLNEIRSLKSNS